MANTICIICGGGVVILRMEYSVINRESHH